MTPIEKNYEVGERVECLSPRLVAKGAKFGTVHSVHEFMIRVLWDGIPHKRPMVFGNIRKVTTEV